MRPCDGFLGNLLQFPESRGFLDRTQLQADSASEGAPTSLLQRTSGLNEERAIYRLVGQLARLVLSAAIAAQLSAYRARRTTKRASNRTT